ncbi:CbiQ family ECF transporter T component [Paenibacillus rhizoplanae]
MNSPGAHPFCLAGGEKRRVCIAGALAVQPGLLILDEPTAGLDPQAAQALLEMVQELRSSGLTLIIGTHDLDSFLPVADKVIVMKQGVMHYDGPAPALTADPGLLADAGLTPPRLCFHGTQSSATWLAGSSPGQSGGAAGRTGKSTLCLCRRRTTGRQALATLQAAAHQHPAARIPKTSEQHSAEYSLEGTWKRVNSPRSSRTERVQTIIRPGNPRQEQNTPRRPGWQGLDPRAKWLGMILGSLVLLGMNTLLPLLLTAGLLAGLAASAHISWRRAFRFFRPFLLMFLFLWLLAGLSWSSPDFALGPLSFSYEGLMRGGISVLRFLLLITLGFLFTETTTGAPLREGLEWGIAPLRTLGIRTRNWSLAVSVTLQFVPWILGKLDQLQLALGSRGRRARGVARWSPRQIALIIVPLLILVLGMGDELATAVESRGV